MNLIGDDPTGRKSIGEQTDFVGVPYNFGENSVLAYLATMYYHVHGQFIVYPDHANAIVLTSSSAAWSETGPLVEVIPSGALSVSAFDLHWINISDISAVAQIQIDIYAGEIGSEVRICATRSQRNTNQSRENANRIQIPQQTPGTRISCRLSDSSTSSITAAVSFEGHYYA